MKEKERRDNELVIAGAFFRELLAEDASGVDVGLAAALMESLATAGDAPETLEYACTFEAGGRAAGQWTFHWRTAQVAGAGSAVDLRRTHAALCAVCDFEGELKGMAEAVSAVDPVAVRSASIGFDARVQPELTRVRFSLELVEGRTAPMVVQRIFDGLGLRRDARALPPGLRTILLEYGPEGPTDLRLGFRLAPATVREDPNIKSQPDVGQLLTHDSHLSLLRSVRNPAESELVIAYGAEGADAVSDDGELPLVLWGRRSSFVAELRRAVRKANRGLPGETGLVMRPWAARIALRAGRPLPDDMTVVFRPLPF